MTSVVGTDQGDRVPDVLVGRLRDVPRHRVDVPELLGPRRNRENRLDVVRGQFDHSQDGVARGVSVAISTGYVVPFAGFPRPLP